MLRTWLWLALVALLLGCGSDSTAGRPVALETEVALDTALETVFETNTGWRVKLSAAAVSLAALYYYDGEPAFARRATPSWRSVLAQLWGPSVAHAHPGHYVAGSARGQMTQAAATPLSVEPSPLPPGAGVSGSFRSGHVVFAEDDGGLEELDGAVARVQGRAEKGDQTVYFSLSATFEDVARNAQAGAVRGCAFDEADVQGDGTVSLHISPKIWLDFVRFDALEAGSAEQPTEVPAGDDAQFAFAVGVAQLSAYRFVYRAKSE